MSLAPKFALSLAAALALAACNGSSEEAGSLEGEPVAAVPAPDGGDWTQIATRTETGGWLVGNPDAPIRLVEYGSLTCGACANFAAEAKDALMADYVATGRVSFELRSVLLSGVVDLLLTRMLDCAPANVAVPLANQIWGNLETVVSGFQANGPALEQAMNLPPEQRYVALARIGGVTDFFAARGISADMAQMCLSDAAAIEALAQTSQAAVEADGVTGTPTFFLNGQRLDGTRWSVVEPALQRAGAR